MIGINLSGGSFGESVLPGVLGENYYYPGADEIKFYTERGCKLFRVSFLWERMQPKLGGMLSGADLSGLLDTLDLAADAGAKVIIDCHNYGRYNGRVLGAWGGPTYAQFADLWAKLAGALHGYPALIGLGLMNEPHDMPGAGVWQLAAQAATDAIRKVDTKTDIYVAGNNWSNTANWSNIRVEGDGIVYEGHCYFDATGQGYYAHGYDEEGATPDTGIERLVTFTLWLKRNNQRGFIGECGVPSNDPRWLTTMRRFLDACIAAGIDVTVWSGGFWWPDDYPLLLAKPELETEAFKLLQGYWQPAPAPASVPATTSPALALIDEMQATLTKLRAAVS